MLCSVIAATGMSIEIVQNFPVMNSPLSRTMHFGSAEYVMKMFSHSPILTMKMNSSLQYKTLEDVHLSQLTRAYMSIWRYLINLKLMKMMTILWKPRRTGSWQKLFNQLAHHLSGSSNYYSEDTLNKLICQKYISSGYKFFLCYMLTSEVSLSM